MSGPLQSDPQAIGDLITVSKDQTWITADAGVMALARQRFADTCAVVVRQFLAPTLLADVQARVHTSDFQVKVHDASGVEDCMVNNDTIWLLRFLLGTTDILHAVETITGVAPLTKCQVRIYRFVPDSGQRHDWHDDIGEGRRLGLSINLSEAMFDGGNLQVRDEASGRLRADVRNTGPGDAVIFRLGHEVEHQVLPVVGAHPRVALAGWFRT